MCFLKDVLQVANFIYRKNVTKGYSEAQIKVRKATSNEAWGPEGTDMAEIAQMTYDRYDSSPLAMTDMSF